MFEHPGGGHRSLEMEPWDFAAVYFDSIDHFSHAFMDYHPPRREGIPEKDYEIYKDVVEGGYRFHDMMLGVLMGLAGPETAVIIVSDHGFHSDHLRPRYIPTEPAGPAVQHRQYGIVAMRGPGIRQDERVYGASLLDICPTVLTLLGLPVGRDMDGKPLVGAFLEPPRIETIASWDDVPGEDGRHPPGMRIDPIEAQEAINQLVVLGYIEKPEENREKAVAQAVSEWNYNLRGRTWTPVSTRTPLPCWRTSWRNRPTSTALASNWFSVTRQSAGWPKRGGCWRSFSRGKRKTPLRRGEVAGLQPAAPGQEA